MTWAGTESIRHVLSSRRQRTDCIPFPVPMYANEWVDSCIHSSLHCTLVSPPSGVTVALDFWLGSWSGEANTWNATEAKNWKAYSTYLRRTDDPGEGAEFVEPPVEASALHVRDRYQAFVKETVSVVAFLLKT